MKRPGWRRERPIFTPPSPWRRLLTLVGVLAAVVLLVLVTTAVLTAVLT